MTAARGAQANRNSGVVTRGDGIKHLTPQYADAFLGLVRAGGMLDRTLSAELERRHGLSLRAFEVLLFLAAFSPDGSMRMTDLIAAAPLSQSRVSRLVAELESRGLVQRGGVDGDGRAVAVSITPAGVEAFRAAQETHLAGLDRRLFSRLTDREIAQLGRITAKIVADAD